MTPSCAGRVVAHPAVLALALLMVAPSVQGHPGSSSTQQLSASGATLVIPFDNREGDPRLYWLAEGSALLVAESLEQLGGVLIAREERLSAFEHLQLPPAAALSHATVIKVGHLVGASEVVIGSYEIDGDRLTVRARLMLLDAGRLLPEITEQGALTDLFATYDRATRRLREPDARPTAAPLVRWALPQAFELYVKGLIAETPVTQRSYLEQALHAAPDDDRVRLALWQVLTNAGDHVEALEAVTAVPATSQHSRDARYFAALSQIELGGYDEAFRLLLQLQAERRAAEVLNAMGIVQLRRGNPKETGAASYYFGQATQLDPSDPDYFFNLGYAYWLDRDPPAAIYWLREVVRRNAADGDAHYLLGTALQRTSATAEASREKELARRLSSEYVEWDRRAAAGHDPIPRGLERAKDRLDRQPSRVAAAIVATGQRDQTELAAFHLDQGRRAFAREADHEAEQALRRAMYLSPYLAEAHLLLGHVYLRGGRPADAVAAFKISLWSEPTVAAHLGLAEAFLQVENLADARAEVVRALQLDPESAEAKALHARIGG